MTDDRAHLLRTAVTMEQEFVVSNEVEETEARAHAMQELEVERERVKLTSENSLALSF